MGNYETNEIFYKFRARDPKIVKSVQSKSIENVALDGK